MIIYEGLQDLGSGDMWHRCTIVGILFFVKRNVHEGRVFATARLIDPDRSAPATRIHEVRACSSLHNAVWLSAAKYQRYDLCMALVTMDCDKLWEELGI